MHIIEKEDGEIHHNGDVCRVLQGSQRPEDNEHDIIDGIPKRIIGRSQHGQGCSQETGDDGKRTEYNVGGIQSLQYQIEHKSNNATTDRQ